MHPPARIALFTLAGLAPSLLARGTAELDDHPLKIEKKTGPSRVEFHFRRTEQEGAEEQTSKGK